MIYFNYLTKTACNGMPEQKHAIFSIFRSDNSNLKTSGTSKARKIDTIKQEFVRGSHLRSPIRVRPNDGLALQTQSSKHEAKHLIGTSVIKHGSWFPTIFKKHASFNTPSAQSSPSLSSRSSSSSVAKTSRPSNKSNFLLSSTRLSELKFYIFNYICLYLHYKMKLIPF